MGRHATSALFGFKIMGQTVGKVSGIVKNNNNNNFYYYYCYCYVRYIMYCAACVGWKSTALVLNGYL